jgi:hypothetical protein
MKNYFKYCTFNLWYRESTKQWILEVNLNKPPIIGGTYRYSSKTIFGAILKYLYYFNNSYKDSKLTK